MEFQIAIEELQKALGRTQGIAERKTSIPILANVLIEASAENGFVRFTTFDLDIAMISEHPAEIAVSGAVTVQAKTLFNLARTITSPMVRFAVEGSTANISFGSFKGQLPCLPADEYPKLPNDESASLCKVNSQALIDLISKTSFSVSKDDTRPILHGLFFEAPEQGKMRAVSTDGHRLSLMNRSVEDGELVLPRGVIFPLKGLTELKKLLEEAPEAESFIGFTDTSAIFKRQGLTMIMRLIDGQFPEYQEVIPQDTGSGIRINRAELMSAIRTVSNFIETRNSSIRLRLEEGNLNISASGEGCGNGTQNVAVEYSGGVVEIGFNANYIKDVLSVIDDTEIMFSITDDQSPGVIKPASSQDFVAVIMPMRI